MELTFRTARASDECRDLLYSSAPELYDYMYRRGPIRAQDYIAHEFRAERGFIAHPIHTVALHRGEVAAVGAFYTWDDYPAMQRGSAYEILRFYGFTGTPSVLRAASHSGSVINRPRPGCVYIANLGVRSDLRGRGVGSALVEHETDKARRAGYETMTLDVADNNPRAEALYTRLGFEFQKQKCFRGSKGNRVPDARFMMRAIRA
ncbi:MAG: GNAT family N-acetyltransferase [Myxococcota bacterium]